MKLKPFSKNPLIPVMASLGIAFGASAAESPDPELKVVDRHIVVAIDCSPSIDLKEYAVMMWGIKEAFLSEETYPLDSGFAYALSVLCVGKRPIERASEIVYSRAELKKFTDNVLWDSSAQVPYPQQQISYTSTLNGLRKVKEIFDSERERGFTTTDRAVVIMGDGIDTTPFGSLEHRNAVKRLAEGYNATAYAIPITIAPGKYAYAGAASKERTTPIELESFYCQNLVTPAGYKHEDVPVKAGACLPTTTFEGVQEMVKQALRLDMF